MSLIRTKFQNNTNQADVNITQSPSVFVDKTSHQFSQEKAISRIFGGNSSNEITNFDIKSLIHKNLVDNLDLKTLINIENSSELKSKIEDIIINLINEHKVVLTVFQKQALISDILNETLGLGPLEPLLSDYSISDIMVNGPQDVYVDRFGKIEKVNIYFKDNAHLMHIINRIVSKVGRRIDESCPIADARLLDGSRVNAIIPPLAINGPTLSIRRFAKNRLKIDDLINFGALNLDMAQFLKLCVEGKLNILVSGGTSTGKTTLLNILSSFIGEVERTITIEDTAELSLWQKHVIQLEARPSNIEGVGAVTCRDLVKNALRMRPDRIIVGEVRGPEALDMLQAMNTGHQGSLTTLHANSTRDALSRIETLVMLGQFELSQKSIREQMSQAFDIIIQIKRLRDGSRKIVNISEITGIENDIITMHDIFVYDINNGHIKTNIRPVKLSKIEEEGVEIPQEFLKFSI